MKPSRRGALSRLTEKLRPRKLFTWPLNDARRRLSRFIVDHEHRVVYRPVPKVACTSWKSVMRRVKGLEPHPGNMAHLVHDPELSGLCFLDGDDEASARDVLAKYWTFCFVRDPWSRTLSAYLNKVRKHLEPGARETVFRRYAQDHALHSFETFVDHLLRQRPCDMNDHWAPQAFLLMKDSVRYDFVGRFEHLEDDARTVLDRLGISESFATLSELPHQTNASSRLAEFYTPALVDKVAHVFRDDVGLSDYAPPALPTR